MSIRSLTCVIGGLAVTLSASTMAFAGQGTVRVAPPTVHFGVKQVGTYTLKDATITNASSQTVLLQVSGEWLPDDFSFGNLPGSNCGLFDPAPLAPGQSCKAVVGFQPSEYFAGREQRAQLRATATDPVTGAVLETVLIEFVGTGH